jgi:chromosome segregation ATPase
VTTRAERAEAHAQAAEQRAQGLAAGFEMERSTTAASLDDERAEMQRHIAEADARVRELEGQLAHKVNELGSALEDARSRAEDAERRVATTMERAEDAERRATETSFAVQAAETRARGLEQELEQAQLRARRAYQEAETANSQLSSTNGDNGTASADGAEVVRLRTELAHAIERANAAEERLSRAQADLRAADAADADADEEPEPVSAPVGGEGASFRHRLTRAADRKKGHDADQWSG